MWQLLGTQTDNSSQLHKPSSATEISDCQAQSFADASVFRIPRVFDYMGRTVESVRRVGVTSTLQKIFTFASKTLKPKANVIAMKPAAPLNLKPGELVEVKSAAEIVETLDSSGALGGLMFLPAMQPYCGKRFTVLKRMERMYLEESGTLRKVRNTVLLNGAMCDGLLMRCDRSCFFYWREAWLKRVNDKAPPDPSSAA